MTEVRTSKVETLTCCPVKYQRQPGGIWNGFHGPKDFTGQGMLPGEISILNAEKLKF